MTEQRILVTGCAGFIGSHLVRRLLADADVDVLGIDCFDPMYARSLKIENLARLPADRFRLAEIDITDRETLTSVVANYRPSTIYHLAALAGVRPSIAQPERYVKVNVDGLTNVLDAARQAGCADIVFASSSSVYGNASRIPFREDDPADQPISPYAATKRAGELICHTYAHLFSLRIACLRFFTVYGPGQRPDLAIMSFMKRIAGGEPIQMFGDGRSSRDYTYIDDIIDGVVAAGGYVRAAPGRTCRIFNIGGSQPVSLRDMIGAIEKTLGRTAQIERTAERPGDVERTFADLERSAAELGYQPRVSFEVGLRRQWEWLQPRLACEPAPVG